mmetsp:Transcript_35546/g.84553  ORF Transcript_35546/g.84553 Transcript_35546/m.84553 type:complete len:202 (+) Transcript_35546:154-759(+)
MSHESFTLTDSRLPLEVEALLLPEVLECLLHHILFHRALAGKAVLPKDMVILDEVFYAKCDDQALDKQVRDSVEAAVSVLKKTDGGGKVSLILYEKEKPGGMWGKTKFGPWEEWSIHLAVRTEPVFGHREETLRRKELQGRVRDTLWRVHSIINSCRKHLPKQGISNDSSVCYPFEIKDPSHHRGSVLALLSRVTQADGKQ